MNEQASSRAWRARLDEAAAAGAGRNEHDRRDLGPVPLPGGGRGGAGDRRPPPPPSAYLGDPGAGPPASTELGPARGGYLSDAYMASPAFGNDGGAESDFNLRKYVALLVKHRWMILASMLVCLAIGVGITLLTTPIYRANATLQINRDVAQIVEGQDLKGENTGAEFYQTQYELLKSRSLAERVVASLSLQDDPAFAAAVDKSIWTRLREIVFGSGQTADTTSSQAVAARQRQAAGRLVSDIAVEPIRSSSIVKISFDSPSPQIAAKVVNAIADSYISLNLERRYDASAYARTFLEERLAELKLKLQESEKQAVAYAESQQIVDPGSGPNLAQTNLSSANGSYTSAVNERVRAELLWQQVKSEDVLPQFLETPSIASLRAKKADLEAQYKDKLAMFKPAYPDMQKLSGQIDEIQRQVAAETRLVKDSIKAKYDAALSAEKSLSAQVDGLKGEVNDFRSRNIQYTILQREVDTNRQLYDGLLQRYKEIGVAGGVGVNNVAIVDKAQVPGSAYSPSMTRNLAIALMIGALFGIAGAFAREQFDDTFKSPEDIEENLGLPLLGMIPKTASPEDHVEQMTDPRSALAEAYRSLRTALQFSTTTGVPKTLLVTSSRASEGKSTTASTLAKNFAALGMKVLIIDADLRKPSLHTIFKKDSSQGLSNCLISNTVPPELFQKTDVAGLTYLASGPLPPNPAELIASAKMLSLLTVAAETYDLVVIDGPPVSGLADSPLLASLADGTLLVVDPSTARRGMVKAALKRLAFARAQMVGVVVNKVDMNASGYGYGYGYGYGNGYGDHYYGGAETEKLPKPASIKGLVARLKRR